MHKVIGVQGCSCSTFITVKTRNNLTCIPGLIKSQFMKSNDTVQLWRGTESITHQHLYTNTEGLQGTLSSEENKRQSRLKFPTLV